MKHKYKPSSPRSRPGVTLIEIVAGLVILGLLVSSLTIARGRFMRQWSESDKKLQATRATDRMIASWLGSETDSIPVPSRGTLEGVEGCDWRTYFIDNAAANRIGASIVRLEVFHADKRLLFVDLLKHNPTRTDREGQP